MRWSVELCEFDIRYILKTIIKAHALANFISKLTLPLLEFDKHTPPTWMLFVDGSVTLDRGGARLILKDPNKQEYKQALRFGFKISNNELSMRNFSQGFGSPESFKFKT